LELRLMMETAPGTMEGIHLLTEGDGRWTDAEEQHIPELEGCLDIDIPWSPLTNSLPINRMNLIEGDSQDNRLAYVSLPDLSLQVIEQQYTLQNDSRVLVSTRGVQDDFILSVDSDGFVTEHPEVFVRSWPR